MVDIFSIVRCGKYMEYRSAIDLVDVNILDENGSNLLAPAIVYDRPEIVRDLLQRGIDMNHKGERQMTAIQLAIQWRRSDIAKTLVELGSDLNSRDVWQ